MDKRKLGNIKQICFAYEMQFTSQRERGKNCILVKNGDLELMFSVDNGLDISSLSYLGKNISFMSKNGLNDGTMDFNGNFEGGFLYTCGLDNLSSCVKGKPVHGSLHYTKAEDVAIERHDDKIVIFGKVRESSLFGKNIVLSRRFEVYKDRLVINDCVENMGFLSADYVLLYHTNFGYPFLDEGLEISLPSKESIPLTEISEKRKGDMFKITPPIDGGVEDVYYHILKEGKVSLLNRGLGIEVGMSYSLENFPFTLQWKSMISGDYALGIEPSVTRFDEFKMRKIEGLSKKDYTIKIDFKKIN